METNLHREIERLQERCLRLDFENRRLRRTLRCVDCNSRIATTKPKDRPMAVRRTGRERTVQSSALGVSSSTTPCNWHPVSAQGENGLTECLVPFETTVASSGANADAGLFDSTFLSNTDGSHAVDMLATPEDTGYFLESELVPDTTGNAPQGVLQLLEELYQKPGLMGDSPCLDMNEVQNTFLETSTGSESGPDHSYEALLQMCSGVPRPISAELTPSSLGIELGFNMGHAHQRMDQYIKVFGTSIRSVFGSQSTPSRGLESLISYGVLWIVREAWPAAEGFWKLTASLKSFVQSELWRLFPCRSSYEKLHPAYRPTFLQLTVPHSPLIDWLPWPDLRDRIIQLQDQLNVEAVCKSAIESVVAHRQLLPGPDTNLNLPTFRVWDLHLLEKQSGVGLTNNQLTYKPRAASVLAIEKAYNLVYDDFLTQRLHPAFFKKYPLITCERIKTKFRVQSISVVNGDEVGDPKPFTEMAKIRLKQLVTKSVHRSDT